MNIDKKSMRTIHEHLVILATLGLFLGAVGYNNIYLQAGNCQAIEISVDCSSISIVPRTTFTAPMNSSQYFFIPAAASIYHLDEYRSYPPHFVHGECNIGATLCAYYYDSFSGLPQAGLFALVSHMAETISTYIFPSSCVQRYTAGFCADIIDYIAVIIAWMVIFFSGYYIYKVIEGVR